MVYGNFARALGTTRGGENLTVNEVSESDSIINFLLNESENYNNLILNESYITEDERLIAEAKLEVIQEAVSGAIIAAIIAIVTAIAAFIAKFIGMMKNGAETINKKKQDISNDLDEEKKNLDNQISSGTADPFSHTENNSEDENKKRQEEFEKQMKKEHEERVKKYRTQAAKEISERLKKVSDEVKSGSLVFLPKSLEEKINSAVSDNIHNDKFKGFNGTDFSTLINSSAFKVLNDWIRAAGYRDFSEADDKILLIHKDSEKGGSRDKYAATNRARLSEGAKEELDNLTNKLFNSFDISEDIKPSDHLITLYNKGASNRNIIGYISKFLSSQIPKNAESVQTKMQKDIDTLKKTLEQLKKDNFNSGSKKGTNGRDNDDFYRGSPDDMRGNSFSSNHKKEQYKQFKDHQSKIDKSRNQYLNAMMYIEKEAVGICQSFINTWAQLEKYRLQYSNLVMSVYKSNIKKCIYDEVIEKYKDLIK